MTYIKKMVLQGFKSFAPKTEVVFDKGINVFVGPNGSGKSNISDALCFALGRLSIKSMRAEKAKNLIFMGSKNIRPTKEASVEVIFDNAEKKFSINREELSLKRIVRTNGQSIYKINGETKTRSEVLETLAQAGIDPYGFNIILQGQIQSISRMHGEERRKIIEEVAGISIYELRKEKSLKELEKTETRLKEISTILRERTSYLKNLEKERAQALKYKELENTIKKYKASILKKQINEKEKEINSVKNSIKSKLNQKEKTKQKSEEIQKEIESLNEKIKDINKHIQKSTGIEQEKLNEDISNLKAELEGLRVRKENYENKISETETRISEMNNSVSGYQEEIESLKKKSPLIAKKQEELKNKKQELSEIEEERKNIYSIKTELNSLKERVKEKENSLTKTNLESDSLLKEMESLSENLKFENFSKCEKFIKKQREKLVSLKKELEQLTIEQSKNKNLISVSKSKIEDAQKIKSQIKDIDVCPLCQNKMTEEHFKHVTEDSDSKISSSQEKINFSQNNLEKTEKQIKKINEEINFVVNEINNAEKELSAQNLITDKKNYLKKLVESEKITDSEIKELQKRKDFLNARTANLTNIEEKYKAKLLEIEEISSRTEEDHDTTLLFKERELEKITNIIKLSKKDLIELEEDLSDISLNIEKKGFLLEKKEEEAKKLDEKFDKLFKERDKMQEKIQTLGLSSSDAQNEWRQVEDQINYLKVGNAKLSAEKESLEMELKEFPETEVIKAGINILQEKLKKSQETINSIGSINMRALEVYSEIKQEYDKVYEKVRTLEKEKEEIIKIIEEIDRKKKRTFMKTFNGINEIFTNNFAKLYSKGSAFLEIENKEDIFSGGINIAIKLAKGKYFDVTSLSGGEQTLVAISLLFAIQEYSPYHFYILDEIDAALDKRNSERLSALLKQYMKSGQYIVVTHNDAIILDSNILYGVSMHDGISKILSMKVQ